MAFNKNSLSNIFDNNVNTVTYKGETMTIQQYKRLIKKQRKAKKLLNS